MTEKKIIPSYSILLLVASQFHEVEVSIILRELRQLGISVVLTSLKAGKVTSEFDMTLKPDCSVECLQFNTPYSIIIVPGGRDCALSLLRDPRIHQLFQASSQSSRGFLVCTSSAEEVLRDNGALEFYHPWVLQREKSLSELAKQIVSLLQVR